MAKKKTLPSEVVSSEAYVKDFFDMVVPSTIKFNVDHLYVVTASVAFGQSRNIRPTLRIRLSFLASGIRKP